MRKIAALCLSSMLFACGTTGVGKPVRPSSIAAEPVNAEQLRRLFLSGHNTYLNPVLPGGVIVDHPQAELFRANGTYWRSTRRTGIEGKYAIEGNKLCVMSDFIGKHCRSLASQGGMTYLLIDDRDGSRTLVDLSYRK